MKLSLFVALTIGIISVLAAMNHHCFSVKAANHTRTETMMNFTNFNNISNNETWDNWTMPDLSTTASAVNSSTTAWSTTSTTQVTNSTSSMTTTLIGGVTNMSLPTLTATSTASTSTTQSNQTSSTSAFLPNNSTTMSSSSFAENSTTQTMFANFSSTTTTTTTTATAVSYFSTTGPTTRIFVPTTTVAAGLPSTHPFEGFYVVITPHFVPTTLTSGTSNTTSLQQFLTKQIVSMLTQPDPSLNPPSFDASAFRQKVISSFRSDLSRFMNMPAGDIGIESIVQYSGDSTGQSIQIRFRVSLIRALKIGAALNQTVTSSSSNGGNQAVSWMTGTMNQLQATATAAVPVSLSIASAGVLGARPSDVAMVQAAPDASGATTAAPPVAATKNAACFVGDNDCIGSGIVIGGIIFFIVALAISIRLFWTIRKAEAAQVQLEEHFSKEVKSRNEVRSKLAEFELIETKGELARTLRKQELEAKRQQPGNNNNNNNNNISRQQPMEMEMTPRQQQFQNPGQHHGQLHDGLIGTSYNNNHNNNQGRSQQYQVDPQDRLAQTAPNPQHLEYDDFL